MKTIKQIRKDDKAYTIEPINDNIIVEVPGEELVEVEQKIITSKQGMSAEPRRPIRCIGKIASMGKGRILRDGTLVKINEDLHVGDMVFINPSSGIKMNIPKDIEKPYNIIVKESDIIGKIV